MIANDLRPEPSIKYEWVTILDEDQEIYVQMLCGTEDRFLNVWN